MLQQQELELQRLEVDEARQTIGVFLAMDGSNERERECLRNKTEEFQTASECDKI